jgi:HK97 family phage major capsid protein
MLKLHELQEQRAAAVAEMRTLSDTAETQKRDLTADEDTKFGTLKTTIADLDKKIGRAQTLAEAERSAPAVVHGRLGDGAYEERARDFSITRAIRALLPRDLGGGDVDAGFEREISAEVARRSGRKFEGLAVPDQVFQQPQENLTLLVGSSAEGLTPTPLRADLFIDRLRNRLVVARLGATYLDGLVGSPIDIPRQTGSSTAQWVAEDGSLSETDAAFDDVTLTPKTVGSMTSYSRRTLLNASPSIEQIVRNDLAAVIAQAIDAKAMTGDGSSNTPTGILHTSGVHDTGAGSAIAWDEVLDFIALIDGSNALDGALGWAINPFVVKKLRSTLVDSNTAGKMIMEEPNELAGYPALSSMQLPGGASDPTSGPESAMIFGDWSQLLVGSWTGVDILLNPYETTAYAKGRVIVRAMKDVDVAVRHGQAFAFANAISAN